MRISKIAATCTAVMATAIVFAGCAGITHEPKVDMAALPAVDDKAFLDALHSIGVDDRDIRSMVDTSFSFTDDNTEYEIKISLDTTSDKNNQYSYTRCADEATAMDLFNYYYDNYDHVFDAKEFSGISSHETGSNSAYVLIDGRYDNENTSTYTPYHDAIYLKGDTVIVVIASDYEFSIEKEVNDFFVALGYPHP